MVRQKSLVPWVIAGLVIAGVMAAVLPGFLKQRNEEALRKTISANAKQLHLALLDFDSDYGSFPTDKLAKEVPAFAGLTGSRVLDQLEAAGCVDDLDRLLSVSDDPNAKWYYFPEASDSSGSARPLFILPTMDGKRVVLRIDGSAKAEASSYPLAIDLSGAVAIPAVKKKR